MARLRASRDSPHSAPITQDRADIFPLEKAPFKIIPTEIFPAVLAFDAPRGLLGGLKYFVLSGG